MADRFTLTVDAATQPNGSPSGVAIPDIPFLETLSLTYKKIDTFALEADGAQAVVLPGGTTKQAHVVILKAVGGKVVATITHADGTTQTVSFDSVFIWINQTAPMTALSLTRVAGTATTVHMFLGQQ